MPEKYEAIVNRGKIYTRWSGLIRMPDGGNYSGYVYKLDDGLYVLYKGEAVSVEEGKLGFVVRAYSPER